MRRASLLCGGLASSAAPRWRPPDVMHVRGASRDSGEGQVHEERARKLPESVVLARACLLFWFLSLCVSLCVCVCRVITEACVETGSSQSTNKMLRSGPIAC